MIALNDDTTMCLSGGAEGADLQWGMCAGLLGHKVIHWSFEGHKSLAPNSEIVQLTDEQLSIADPFIEDAARWIEKRPPVKPHIKRLIQRNYYQVAWADAVYAVTSFDGLIAQGGTAWAIYMYLGRQDSSPKRCYVFDQATNAWFTWNENQPPWEPGWDYIEQPPMPSGVWAGIGTRDLTPEGKAAIRSVMNYQKPI